MLSIYHASGYTTDTAVWKKHLLRVPDYLWVSEDGMKVQGYYGSQGWDASFTMQEKCIGMGWGRDGMGWNGMG